MGEPLAPVLVNSLYENFHAATGGEQTMMAVHAVRFLATAKKDRTSAEHTDLVIHKVESGQMVVSVPDYALCVHTKAGQEMGRDLLQWWANGAVVKNELEFADHTYRDQLIDVCRAED